MNYSTITIRSCIIFFWIILYIIILYCSYFVTVFSQNRSITVFSWAEMIDPALLIRFEQETGIKVYLRYFENNEELFAKLLVNHGHGIDMVIPSDYIVEQLIQHKLIKPIDKEKLSFWDNIDPFFLQHYYDYSNMYAIPYNWSMYGIAYDAQLFDNPAINWGSLFVQQSKLKIQMPNSARESCLLAAYYLFNKIDGLSDPEWQCVKQLLINQKSWIEAYTDTDARAQYLLESKSCAAAVIASSFIGSSLNKFQNIDYALPRSGTFMIIDNIVLTATTTSDELIYQFINFLFRQDILHRHMIQYAFMPTSILVWNWLETQSPRLSKIISEYSGPIDFFRNTYDNHTLQKIWLTVKVI